MHISQNVKPAAWGAVAGAVALAIIGFTWGGWVTGSSAEMATQKAVVASLVPICVGQFQQSTDAPLQQAELHKITTWDRAAFVEKAGWATMPGSTQPNSAVAKVCAGLINDLKL